MLIRYINKVTVHSNYESTIYKLYLLIINVITYRFLCIKKTTRNLIYSYLHMYNLT